MKTITCNVIPPAKTALLLMLLMCCVSASAPPATLHRLLQLEQAQAPGKKQVIFCINPDDCVNCIYNFHQQFERAQQSKTSQVHVIFKYRRAAERKKILAEEFRDIDTTRSHIYWNDALYADAVKQSKINHTSSIMLIYDAQGKQRFSKLVKEINGTEKEIIELKKQRASLKTSRLRRSPRRRNFRKARHTASGCMSGKVRLDGVNEHFRNESNEKIAVFRDVLSLLCPIECRRSGGAGLACVMVCGRLLLFKKQKACITMRQCRLLS